MCDALGFRFRIYDASTHTILPKFIGVREGAGGEAGGVAERALEVEEKGKQNSQRKVSALYI
jgi:hypothetical protein